MGKKLPPYRDEEGDSRILAEGLTVETSPTCDEMGSPIGRRQVETARPPVNQTPVRSTVKHRVIEF